MASGACRKRTRLIQKKANGVWFLGGPTSSSSNALLLVIFKGTPDVLSPSDRNRILQPAKRFGRSFGDLSPIVGSSVASPRRPVRRLKSLNLHTETTIEINSQTRLAARRLVIRLAPDLKAIADP